MDDDANAAADAAATGALADALAAMRTVRGALDVAAMSTRGAMTALDKLGASGGIANINDVDSANAAFVDAVASALSATTRAAASALDDSIARIDATAIALGASNSAYNAASAGAAEPAARDTRRALNAAARCAPNGAARDALDAARDALDRAARQI